MLLQDLVELDAELQKLYHSLDKGNLQDSLVLLRAQVRHNRVVPLENVRVFKT